MNVKAKLEQARRISLSSKSPVPLILDLMRIKRADYRAECRGLNFDLHAGCHEWYTLYENVIREDYFTGGIAVGEGGTVIDIGANFGSFTAVAAKKVGPSGKVIAFEPNPDVCERLRRNVAMNALGNVEVRNEAVAGADGEIVLLLQQRSSLTTAYANIDARPSEDARPVPVKATSIRSILQSVGGTVDLLKIDCEGAEYDILDALDAEAVAHVRQIAMEVHKVEGREEAEIGAKLSALGFRVTGELPMLAAFKTH